MIMVWFHADGLGEENARFDKIIAVWRYEGLADIVDGVVCWQRVWFVGRNAPLTILAAKLPKIFK